MKLDIMIGGFGSRSYRLTSRDLQTIQYFQSEVGPHYMDEPELIRPTRADWEAFWAAAEACRAWKSQYDDLSVLDGTQWEVHLKHGGLSVECDGSNAYPDDWADFVLALRKLIGGRAFGV